MIRGIREDLAKLFESDGYHVYDVLPEMAELPLVAVSWPDRVRYHVTLTGGCVVDLVVTVAFPVGDDFDASQRKLDAVLDPEGFPSMVYGAGSDHWSEATVIEASNVRQVNVGAQALAVDLVVEVTV